jgi:hypothetical protein
MKRSSWLAAVVASLGFAAPAQARDTKYILKIADVLAMPEANGRIDPAIKLYFGQQGPPGEARGEAVVNPKTNAATKGDEQACKWVMLTAITDLQARAKAQGATSVQNIESYYKKVVFTSQTEFECHAGAVTAGVALRGQLVK